MSCFRRVAVIPPRALAWSVENNSLTSPIWLCRRKYSEYTVTNERQLKKDGFDSLSLDTASYQPATKKKITTTGLERLPTSSVVRNLLLGTMFTSPILFKIGLSVLQRVANSRSPWLNPDSNRLIRAIVKPIVYDQFCAGTNQAEILKTRDTIKSMGFSGVILCYGKEVVVAHSSSLESTRNDEGAGRDEEIRIFEEGNLKTLDMIGEGDWVGIKFTGAGTGITQALLSNSEPPPAFLSAMDAICTKARAKNCRLWIDSEQQAVQGAIDSWTIGLMRKWNSKGQKPLVYNTIQAYLKTSRSKLQHQLRLASSEGWTLGVKLVRGAYIATDPREAIHDSKAETDASYDGLVRYILSGTNLGFAEEAFPAAHLFIAGHNPASVAKAWGLVQTLARVGRLKTVPEFGQLQGMADELGCGLLAQIEGSVQGGEGGVGDGVVLPKVYKCLTWGSVQECIQYMIRRLVENRGGAERMRDGMGAYWEELRRRTFGGRRA